MNYNRYDRLAGVEARPMKKKMINSPLFRTIIILSLFIAFITSFRLAFYVWQHGVKQPTVEDGVFDMTTYDFPYEKSMVLDGDWIFFPNEFINPDHIEDNLAKSNLLHVPGQWQSGFPSTKNNNDATGIGTYYTKIILPKSVHEDTNSLFSIYIQGLVHTGTMYINGEDIETIRTVNAYNGKKMGMPPMTFDFTLEGYTIDLVIHVENSEYAPNGGIKKSVRFGSKHAIDKYATMYNVLQIIPIIFLLVHLVYAWIFYRMSKQKTEVIFYTLLLSVCILTILFSDSYLILNFLPLSFEWLIRTAVSTYILAGIIILLFFRSIYRNIFKGFLFWTLLCLNILLLGYALIPPFSLAAYAAQGSFALTTLTVIYISCMIIKMVYLKIPDTYILILAGASMVSSSIWGVIYNTSSMNMTYYPFDMIFALMILALFMMMRANRTSEEASTLSNQLKQANELKDFFIVSTTHELRNPLQSVINIIHHVITKSTLDPVTEKQMHLVLSATNHMKITLNDFFDISLIQDGKLTLQKNAVSIQAIARGVIDILKYSMDSKSIKIHMDIPNDFPSLYADENRLTQIMFNLIHNAIKFTDEGEIHIKAERHGDIATIHVIDTGIGISDTMQLNIFEPYIHGHESAARSGIGVGLAISKQLVELHGGTIKVHSEKNIGTKFSFTMLLSNEKAGHLVKMNEAPKMTPDYTNETTNMLHSFRTEENLSAYLSNAHILIVDDDPLNMGVITTILADDYRLTTSNNGEEALKLIQEQRFDLVIADVMMPNMSGYELTQKIREMYNISELPVLIFTARNLTEDMYIGFSVGANDYLTKPVNSVELQARVQSLLLLKYSIDQRLHIEAAWLQAQIKPHFLFNTIHSIISLSYIDHERMVHLLEMFSIYLRKSFQPLSTDNLIRIDEELELIEAYIEIQKARFQNRINVHWEIDMEEAFYIPPYSLQTIVENSLSHGILKKVEGGNVWVTIKGTANEHIISVRDDGVGMSADELKNILSFTYEQTAGIGLINTNARLQKVFGTSLTISSKEEEGTTVSFTIPR